MEINYWMVFEKASMRVGVLAVRDSLMTRDWKQFKRNKNNSRDKLSRTSRKREWHENFEKQRQTVRWLERSKFKASACSQATLHRLKSSLLGMCMCVVQCVLCCAYWYR